jgi:hypothetical protein
MINRHTSIKLKVYTLPINHLNTIGFTYGRWEHSHRTNLAVKLTKKDEEKKLTKTVNLSQCMCPN